MRVVVAVNLPRERHRDVRRFVHPVRRGSVREVSNPFAAAADYAPPAAVKRVEVLQYVPHGRRAGTTRLRGLVVVGHEHSLHPAVHVDPGVRFERLHQGL